jgi:DNA-binding FadR family transcriptional regulator
MPMEHEEIEEAILSGDTQRARIVAEDHILRLKQFVMDQGETLFRNEEKNEDD